MYTTSQKLTTHTPTHTLHTEAVKTPLVGPSDIDFPSIDSTHSLGRLSASSSMDSNRLVVNNPIVPSTSFENLHSVYSDSGRGLGSDSPGNSVGGRLECGKCVSCSIVTRGKIPDLQRHYVV